MSSHAGSQIAQVGHSRVPIYEGTKDNIIGMLLSRKLWSLNADDAVPIRSLELVCLSC